MSSLPHRELDQFGARLMYFFEAAARSLEISLDDVSLAVEWSEFESCHLRQRVKPTANEHGLSAQGGFRLARGWYENCTFVNCRWEGHVATDASLLNCTFRGRMHGCAWFGESDRRPNVVRGNGFSEVGVTDNVAWRRSFPIGDQRWPEGFSPVLDD